MIREKPHFRLIELYNSYYFYDVNTNAVIGINKKVHDFFNMLDNNAQDNISAYEMIDTNTKKQIGFLKSQGFLRPVNNNVKIEHQESDKLKEIYKNNLSSVILQVTQNCNLRCEYCIYSGSYINRTHNNKRMSVETAIKSVDFLYKHSSNSKAITIGFYGGEPLLEISLIKKVVEYAEKKFQDKNLMFNITTNATLLTMEIVEYMSNHNFVMTISLDGPKDIQNKNRIFANSNKGSFDTIMEVLSKIKKNYPDFMKKIHFNAVIDFNQDASCANEFFLDYDTVKEISVSGNYMDIYHNKEDVNISKNFFINSNYEIFKVFLYYCNKDIFKTFKPTLFSFEYENIQRQMDRFIGNDYEHDIRYPGGQCLPVVQRFFIDVDGKFFPCERVDEDLEDFCIGNLDDGHNIGKATELLNIAKITKDECINCWAFRMCNQCITRAHDSEKISKNVRLSNCENTKLGVEDTIKNYIALKDCGCEFD